jgi:hypothetical protein
LKVESHLLLRRREQVVLLLVALVVALLAVPLPPAPLSLLAPVLRASVSEPVLSSVWSVFLLDFSLFK